ncbi:MAG: META domain-containing protein [Sphingorhabdus sp.]
MIKKLLFAPPLFLVLAACPRPQSTPAPQTETVETDEHIYAAYGTEPFWDIRIGPGITIFSGLGLKERRFKTPEARPSFNGTRYPGSDISIDITHTVCNDGMSDRLLHDTVTVQIGDKRYRGCGGSTLPPENLKDTSWRFEWIGNNPAAAIAQKRKQFLTFDDETVSGSVGCNRFGGSYKLVGELLTVGPIRSTRMACGGLLGDQEAMLLNMLQQPTIVRFEHNGDMALQGTRYTIRLSRNF